MINNILYATDLGLYAPYLLQHVILLASRHGAKVHAVHAIEPLGVFAESILATYMPPEQVKSLRNKGYKDVMSTIREQVSSSFQDELTECSCDVGLIDDVQVLRGKPADIILESAAHCKADLIVLGSNSQPTEAPSLGSVTMHVLTRSAVPVYMVPMAKLKNPLNFDLYK